jgi:hypothetical protein
MVPAAELPFRIATGVLLAAAYGVRLWYGRGPDVPNPARFNEWIRASADASVMVDRIAEPFAFGGRRVAATRRPPLPASCADALPTRLPLSS